MSFYEVEKIIKKKIVNGKPLYLTKWVGYTNDHNSWEPKESFCNSDFVDQFDSKCNY